MVRQVDANILIERKLKILRCVVHHYIKTAKPVGSSVLLQEYDITFSPATIRNIMAELESEGYLFQPHTSAGRLPTDKGYRAYVDSIMEIQRLAIEEENRIRLEYEAKSREIETLLSQTSRILSGLSQQAGFVLTPKADYNEIQNIELLPQGSSQVLVVLLTKTGMVKHRLVRVSAEPETLTRLRNFLNERLRGLSLTEAGARIMAEVQKFQAHEQSMLKIAEELSSVLALMQDEVYIDGTSNCLSFPDFGDIEQAKTILGLNDNKEQLIELVKNNFGGGQALSVKIGAETQSVHFKDLSVITSVYTDSNKAVGVLGIVGPKRMDYNKMMALLNSVSLMLNEYFKKSE
ncbi:MAG: heat-inducible transcriptional repressor HrcA [Elusimicrobia bacterium]|nr:heat-inducible transcriptional repressor HrcA [Elusimicrobiota bacterium]